MIGGLVHEAKKAPRGRAACVKFGTFAALLLAVSASPAVAGPPYLSDDPQPTDRGHWEIYNFVGGARGPGGLGGEAGFDLNYGGFKDVQLTAVIPAAFDNPRGVSTDGLKLGAGDVELAVKLKVLHQAEGTWTPDIAVFPRLFTPTASRRFESGRPQLLLPVWAQKDFGSWSVFGGGGYEINPGPDQRNFWQGGVAVSRAIGKRLTLGAEVFAQTDDAADGGTFKTVNFALTYKLVEHWSLLASGGPTFENGGGRGQVFYLALKADY